MPRDGCESADLGTPPPRTPRHEDPAGGDKITSLDALGPSLSQLLVLTPGGSNLADYDKAKPIDVFGQGHS